MEKTPDPRGLLWPAEEFKTRLRLELETLRLLKAARELELLGVKILFPDPPGLRIRKDPRKARELAKLEANIPEEFRSRRYCKPPRK